MRVLSHEQKFAAVDPFAGRLLGERVKLSGKGRAMRIGPQAVQNRLKVCSTL
jgi:hypothetical protein